MGHWCRICGETKANEKFSGKGHKNHICKQCALKPKEKIDEVDQTDEIFGFLKQSHISSKNIGRLKRLVQESRSIQTIEKSDFFKKSDFLDF